MAMSVCYQSVDGEILYQSGVDGRIDYLPDALGSVMATTKPNQPDQVDNSYRYKPYGGLLAKTGTGVDPKYLWVGTRTYRDTSLAHSSHYMVARHYAKEEGRWTTVDPLWPARMSYQYCLQQPTVIIDPSGQQGLGKNGLGRPNKPDKGEECRIYNCYLETPWFQHHWICATTANGNTCKLGITPAYLGPPSEGLDPKGEPSPSDSCKGTPGVVCTLMATDCRVANRICSEVKRKVQNPKDTPDYNLVWNNCMTFPGQQLCDSCLDVLSEMCRKNMSKAEILRTAEQCRRCRIVGPIFDYWDRYLRNDSNYDLAEYVKRNLCGYLNAQRR